jgi:hypothetical protein
VRLLWEFSKVLYSTGSVSYRNIIWLCTCLANEAVRHDGMWESSGAKEKEAKVTSCKGKLFRGKCSIGVTPHTMMGVVSCGLYFF